MEAKKEYLSRRNANSYANASKLQSRLQPSPDKEIVDELKLRILKLEQIISQLTEENQKLRNMTSADSDSDDSENLKSATSQTGTETDMETTSTSTLNESTKRKKVPSDEELAKESSAITQIKKKKTISGHKHPFRDSRTKNKKKR